MDNSVECAMRKASKMTFDPTNLVKNVPFLVFHDILPSYPLWIESFGPYKWFTTPLISKITFENNIRKQDIVQFRSEASEIATYFYAEKMNWGDWNNISISQIEECILGNSMRLDKAIIADIAVFLSIIRKNPELIENNEGIFYIYNHLSILPATYAINAMDFRTKSIAIKQIISILENDEVSMYRSEVFKAANDIIRGYTMTSFLGDKISKYYYQKESVKLEFRVIENRKSLYGNGLTAPIKLPFGGYHNINEIFNYVCERREFKNDNLLKKILEI